MLNYKTLAQATARRRAALLSKVAATKESLEAMERELRLLDGILRALPKSGGVGSTGEVAAGRRSAGRRSAGRRATAPSRAKPRGKWRPGRPGRPPKWYLEQQARTPSGTNPGKRSGRKPSRRPGRVVRGTSPNRLPRAKRPPSEKQLAALAKARAARAAKRAAVEATAVTAE